MALLGELMKKEFEGSFTEVPGIYLNYSLLYLPNLSSLAHFIQSEWHKVNYVIIKTNQESTPIHA